MPQVRGKEKPSGKETNKCILCTLGFSLIALKSNSHIRIKVLNYSRKSNKQRNERMIKIKVKWMKIGMGDLLYSTNALCFPAC